MYFLNGKRAECSLCGWLWRKSSGQGQGSDMLPVVWAGTLDSVLSGQMPATEERRGAPGN